MTSDRGGDGARDLSQENTALPFEEAVKSSFEQVAHSASPQQPAHLVAPGADWQASPARRRREWRLTSIPSSMALLRCGLRAFLEEAGLSYDEREDLVLAAGEAATNASEHAQHSTEPFFDVATQIADGVVTIVVHDHGQWRAPTSSPHRGRGLAMMRVLADTSVAVGAHGTTVTLRSHRSHRSGAETVAEGEGRAS
jgi:anti-sigma regulatory factor (Ser/Thr protein kinase)